jgi:hypothetical protein
MPLVIDNFTNNFEARREYALKAEYSTVQYDGRPYHKIHTIEDEEIISLVSDAVKENLTGWSMLRTGLNPTGWIHADSNCGGYAAVLYINDPKRKTGTALWEHKKYGLSSKNLKSQKQINMVNGQSNDSSHWRLKKVIRAKENRVVIYPTDRFHSCWNRSGCDERIVECTFLKRAG